MFALLLALACAPAPVASVPPATAAEADAAGPTTVDGLVAALAAAAARAAEEPAIVADQRALADRFELPTDAAALRDYARVATVFEATRQGGWWWVDWAITDAEPRSDAVWTAWARPSADVATAVAECDETSALFAFLVRRLGVPDAGLLWPRPDHTVAVWMPRSTSGAPVRLIAPTSQVLLGPREGLGTPGFDATLAEAARAAAPAWADRFDAELADRAAVRGRLGTN